LAVGTWVPRLTKEFATPRFQRIAENRFIRSFSIGYSGSTTNGRSFTTPSFTDSKNAANRCKERLRLYVDGAGDPHIEVFDKDSQEAHRLP